MIIYETNVLSIGENAEEFAFDDSFMTFCKEEVPEDLKNYCYIVEKSKLCSDIRKGDLLQVDNKIYKITAVGDVVNININDLAHVSYKFNGNIFSDLPSCINVEKKEMPNIKVGTKIRIIGTRQQDDIIYKLNYNSTTSNLENELMMGESFEIFKVKNKDKFKENFNFKTFFKNQPEYENLEIKDIIKNINSITNIGSSYLYQIFDGLRNPSRDKLLAICIAMQINLKNTNIILREHGKSNLYIRNQRDAIIVHSISNFKDFLSTNELLIKEGFQPL